MCDYTSASLLLSIQSTFRWGRVSSPWSQLRSSLVRGVTLWKGFMSRAIGGLESALRLGILLVSLNSVSIEEHSKFVFLSKLAPAPSFLEKGGLKDISIWTKWRVKNSMQSFNFWRNIFYLWLSIFLFFPLLSSLPPPLPPPLQMEALAPFEVWSHLTDAWLFDVLEKFLTKKKNGSDWVVNASPFMIYLMCTSNFNL